MKVCFGNTNSLKEIHGVTVIETLVGSYICWLWLTHEP